MRISDWSSDVCSSDLSVLLVLIGGVLGLGLAAALGPAITTVSGGVISMPAVDASSCLIGLGLMVAIGLLVGVLPAMSAMRLNIRDPLAHRRRSHSAASCHATSQVDSGPCSPVPCGRSRHRRPMGL